MQQSDEQNANSQFNWRNAALYLATAALLIICLLMLRPFLPAIVGAIVLATVTQRPHRWLLRRIHSRAAAASIMILVITICVIVPGMLLGQAIGRVTINAAKAVQNGSAEKQLNAILEQYSLLGSTLLHGSQILNLGRVAEKTATLVTNAAVKTFSNSLTAITQAIIMLFLLFFVYRDEKKAVRIVYFALPLEDTEAREMVIALRDTIHATFVGRFGIAAIQGLLAGISFAALQVDGAGILGLLTAMVSIIPAFGSYFVWLPVAIYLGITGHWIKMVILIAFGTLVISTIDNVLYPILVGAQLKQHTVSLFFSLLGGVWLFGLPGLILGPVIFAAADYLLTISRRRLHLPPI